FGHVGRGTAWIPALADAVPGQSDCRNASGCADSSTTAGHRVELADSISVTGRPGGGEGGSGYVSHSRGDSRAVHGCDGVRGADDAIGVRSNRFAGGTGGVDAGLHAVAGL